MSFPLRPCFTHVQGYAATCRVTYAFAMAAVKQDCHMLIRIETHGSDKCTYQKHTDLVNIATSLQLFALLLLIVYNEATFD